jgi:hypothetical protein
VINDLEPIFDVPKYMYIWDYQNRKITIPIETIGISILSSRNDSRIIYRYRGDNNWNVKQIDIDPEAGPIPNNNTGRE